MGNNSVPKSIFRLSRFPVYRGSVLGRFYCTFLILPVTCILVFYSPFSLDVFNFSIKIVKYLIDSNNNLTTSCYKPAVCRVNITPGVLVECQKIVKICDVPQKPNKYDVICGNKMPTRCNRCFYCRSFSLLNMFRAATTA